MSAPTITIPGTAGGGVPVGGSGVTGYVAKWTAATTLGGGATSGANASPYIDATGNVGIGTASPTDKLVVAGGLAIAGTLTGATTSTNTLLVDSITGTTRFVAIGTSVSTFGNYVFIASKSGGSPGAVIVCSLDQAGGVFLGTSATAVFSAANSGQGVKLPAAPGNADVQTLDCYQELNLSTGTTSGITTSAGPIILAIRITRIGRATAYAIKISPQGGASLTFAPGWYLTLDGALTPAFAGAMAMASNDATVDRGSAWISDATPPSVYGSAHALGANVSLHINGVM